VWLINTGWSGGAYGTGNRMKLGYTRSMITAAMTGQLDSVEYTAHPIFGVLMPKEVPNVPSVILSPRGTWADAEAYDKKANELAQLFVKNFAKYADQANDEIKSAAPVVLATA
jgi:phosphoenolpyruvate carboxykinase (ATP)